MGRHYIPEDILIELLSRLHIKKLACFKCVSKQWKYIISNKIHVKTNPKLLIFSHEWGTSPSFYTVDPETCVKYVCSPPEESLLGHRVILAHSSCDGLLLTKFFRKVHSYYRLVPNQCQRVNFVIELCFGFFKNNYKVVLVEKFEHKSCKLEYIYSAACGSSSKKKIEVPNHVGNFFSGPYFEGRRHWVCKGYERGNSWQPNHIVYFDPRKNEFIEVPKPQPKFGATDDLFTGLGVLDGCLCIARSVDHHECIGNIEFLVMKEYGNGDSWDVKFVISDISLYFDVVEPIFQTNEGAILVNLLDLPIQIYGANGINILRNMFVGPRDYRSYSVTLYDENWKSWVTYRPQNNEEHLEPENISEDSKEFEILVLGLQGLVKEEHHGKRRKSIKRSEKKSHHRELNKKKGKGRNYEIKEIINLGILLLNN